MTKTEAIKLAIESLEKYKRVFTFEYNLVEKRLAQGNYAKRAHKKYMKISKAIEVLNEIRNNT